MEHSDLIGVEIAGGWRIEEHRDRIPDGSGGAHSLSYLASHPDGGRGFVKVLDPNFNLEAPDPIVDFQLRIAVFQYERQLVEKCLKMSRIVRALKFGNISDVRFSNPIYYLVFEIAECDLREQVELSKRFDLAFRMRVLHQVAVGVRQLHSAQIAHQDLKPSNILVFQGDQVKLGDLGHAHDRAIPRPGQDHILAADPTYAPPEQLYGFAADEWDARRLAADLYLLGSTAVFLFTGVGMTPLLWSHLRPEHHWAMWLGSYEDVLPYVREAWDASIEEFAKAVAEFVPTFEAAHVDELVTLVRFLSEPAPGRRGYPTNSSSDLPRYSMERFISRFDFLAKHAEWRVKQKVRFGFA